MKYYLKLALVGFLVVVLPLALVAWLVYFVFWNAPDPQKASFEDITKFVASNSFTKLRQADKLKYMERMNAEREKRRAGAGTGERPPFNPDDPSNAERRQAMQNVMQVFMAERDKEIKAYFKMASQEEKNKFLDQKIAEHEKRMEEMRKNRPQQTEAQREERRKQREEATKNNNGANPDNNRQRDSEAFAKRMKEGIEKTSPETRAMRDQFNRDMRERAKATGKEMRGPGGPPPGR